MLKLIIADDERIIRETIASIIDWKRYDIEVTGSCSNGIQAYDMILDESPDIVLTDIRMPGMDGIELIKRVSQMGMNTQFIILSGYGEFEYAKEAMKFGVKHYLLKPCNESQILHCILQCKKEYAQLMWNAQNKQQQFFLLNSMYHNIIATILNDRLCQNKCMEEIIPKYDIYIDFHFTPYRLFYFYFLQFEHLPDFLYQLRLYTAHDMENVVVFGCYVNSILILFFQDSSRNCSCIESFIEQVHSANKETGLRIESLSYSSLNGLLSVITDKLRRFSMIYYINNYHITSICNYNVTILQIQNLYSEVKRGDTKKLELIAELLNEIPDMEFVKQLASSLFFKITADAPVLSTLTFAEWFRQMETCTNLSDLNHMIVGKLQELLHNNGKDMPVSPITQQIFNYIENNLNDSNLTLKYIAENHLFMNVDYVSKKFYKETDQKFSQYLTKMRIQKAMQLMSAKTTTSVALIAEQVGCGNSPQYFSQLFKKQTGLTPTEYISSIHMHGI